MMMGPTSHWSSVESWIPSPTSRSRCRRAKRRRRFDRLSATRPQGNPALDSVLAADPGHVGGVRRACWWAGSSSRCTTSVIPQPNDFAVAQATIFEYADGKTQIAHVGMNRVSVPLSQIPLDMQHALLAAEDRAVLHGAADLAHRHPARGQERPDLVRQQPGGRVDDHPAVREELLPDREADGEPQAGRDPGRDQDRRPVEQGPDPAELSEHDLFRARRLRRRDRVAGVFRRTGERAGQRPGQGRVSGFAGAAAVLLRPPQVRIRRRPRRCRRGGTTCSTGWSTRGG